MSCRALGVRSGLGPAVGVAFTSRLARAVGVARGRSRLRQSQPRAGQRRSGYGGWPGARVSLAIRISGALTIALIRHRNVQGELRLG